MKIGIIGAGQLGKMLAESVDSTHYSFSFYDPNPDSCAKSRGQLIIGSFDDKNKLIEFAKSCDLITYEFENVNSAILEEIEEIKPIFPPVKAVKISQSRHQEKSFFNSINIRTPRFAIVSNKSEINSFVNECNLPIVLKTDRFGYDGKGQFILKDQSQLDDALNFINSNHNQKIIAEEFINYSRELSIIAARDINGSIAYYPINQNEHIDGILNLTCSIAEDISAHIEETAKGYIKKLLEELNYIGTLTLELFQVGEELFANEMAPRVHNSGHHTINSCRASQFKNHILAVTKDNIQDPSQIFYGAMINLIGDIPEELRFNEGIHKISDQIIVYNYGKESFPKRKVGHINLIASSKDELNNLIQMNKKYLRNR